MPFWTGKVASQDNIRCFRPGVGWCKYADTFDDDRKLVFAGSKREIDQALTAALNASNLLLLTGAGSSFCASNPPGDLTAPGMTDLWDAVVAEVTESEFHHIVGLIPRAEGIGKNIEKLLTLAKLYVSLFQDSDSERMQRFIHVAEEAILKRVDFVTTGTNINSHKELVRKIARRGIRKPRAKIFTTNYDLCFEKAAQEQRFVVVDGFSHSVPQVYDRSYFEYDTVRRGGQSDGPDYIENVFHLYKLHGSLDWRRGDRGILRSKSSGDGQPVLIYPRDTKYQEAFEPPYLDMMGAFQSAIREPDSALIVSGFGFNDDHISKPIIAAIEANLSLRLIVCDVTFTTDAFLEPEPDIIAPGAPLRVDNPYFRRFLTLAEHGDHRVTLLSGRFEDLASAMPDLVAQTERERHVERMLAVSQEIERGVRA